MGFESHTVSCALNGHADFINVRTMGRAKCLHGIHNRTKVTAEWRKLRNKEVHNLYST